MNKLIIKNDISQLSLDNLTLQISFWKALRFRANNYFFNPQYKKRRWDGFVDFFSKKTGKFGTGLLPEIVKGLDRLHLKVKIDDQRTSKIPFKKINKNIFPHIELYDYQVEIGNKAWKYERGIIKAATGAGKTILFNAIVKSIPKNTPTLILFRSKSLVDQTYKVFKQNGIENVGRLHGTVWDPNIILCTTVQSWKRYESLLDKFEVLIVDECHEFATNKTIQRIFKKMKKCRYRLAFSATPWKDKDNEQKYKLKSWFGPVLGDISALELQGRNILSDSICYFHKIHGPDLELATYEEAYKQGVVYGEPLLKKIKQIIDSYQTGRILIIVERIPQGDELAKMIPGSLWISGKDDDASREYVINKLSSSKPGEKVVAISSRILQTGVNLFLHSLINAAGYKSDIMTIQRIGRGLRTADDKKRLEYHDFYYTNNHYLENHSNSRIKWLKKEGHKIKIVE